MKLKGKVAVVAGASGGIGREIVLALAKRRVNLILVARRKIVLEALRKEAQGFGADAKIFTCDFTKASSIDKLAEKISKQYKKIDILFHLAGIAVYKKFEEISLEEWQRSLDINTTAVFYLTQKLMPQLKASDESFVIASGSGMGKVALSKRSPYCASKFALRGLMLSLAKEYKNTNVRFVHLTLGSVLTAFGPLSLEEKKRKQEKGKKYVDPTWLAYHIVARIEHETLDSEVPIYPSHYFEESRKDKR